MVREEVAWSGTNGNDEEGHYLLEFFLTNWLASMPRVHNEICLAYLPTYDRHLPPEGL